MILLLAIFTFVARSWHFEQLGWKVPYQYVILANPPQDAEPSNCGQCDHAGVEVCITYHAERNEYYFTSTRDIKGIQLGFEATAECQDGIEFSGAAATFGASKNNADTLLGYPTPGEILQKTDQCTLFLRSNCPARIEYTESIMGSVEAERMTFEIINECVPCDADIDICLTKDANFSGYLYTSRVDIRAMQLGFHIDGKASDSIDFTGPGVEFGTWRANDDTMLSFQTSDAVLRKTHHCSRFVRATQHFEIDTWASEFVSQVDTQTSYEIASFKVVERNHEYCTECHSEVCINHHADTNEVWFTNNVDIKGYILKYSYVIGGSTSDACEESEIVGNYTMVSSDAFEHRSIQCKFMLKNDCPIKIEHVEFYTSDGDYASIGLLDSNPECVCNAYLNEFGEGANCVNAWRGSPWCYVTPGSCWDGIRGSPSNSEWSYHACRDADIMNVVDSDAFHYSGPYRYYKISEAITALQFREDIVEPICIDPNQDQDFDEHDVVMLVDLILKRSNP